MLGLQTLFAALLATAFCLQFPDRASFYVGLFFVVCVSGLGAFLGEPRDKRMECKGDQ